MFMDGGKIVLIYQIQAGLGGKMQGHPFPHLPTSCFLQIPFFSAAISGQVSAVEL